MWVWEVGMSQDKDDEAGKRLVEQMTNWQRSRWARAGYPGLANSHYEPNKIRPFVTKVERSSVGPAGR